MLLKDFQKSTQKSIPYTKTHLRHDLMSLVVGNNGNAIRSLLIDYKGELGELEQGFACRAVEVFRKGRSPYALLALLDAGFDLLNKNSEDQCPIDDLVDFWNRAQSREEEARKTIKRVMDHQFDRLIPDIELIDRMHANFIKRVQKRTKRKPRQRKSMRLSVARAFVISALTILTTQFGVYA